MSQGILVNLTISDDKMEAYLDIIPGGGGPEKVDLAYLEGFIENHEIRFGLDQTKLQDIASKALHGDRIDHLLIARGKLPKKGSPSYIKLKERLFHNKPMPSNKLDKIDYRMVSPYIMVKKGEPLGKKMEETDGTEGTNVFGEPVTPGKKDIVQISAGTNTEWIGENENIVAAAIAGRFEFDGKIFSISDILEIAGDVDYSTGHISFAGDVIIQGEIKDGFRVASGGSVFCKKTLDASEVLCRKDLMIEGGIKGRNTGLIRVQGKIQTKFIENCHVEAFLGIAVKTSIMDSEIFTLGELILSKDKGTIIGGTLYAEKGLTVKNLGSPRNSHTLIYSGISYINMRKLNHLQKRLTILSDKMKSLKKLPPNTENLDLLEKAEKAMESLQQGIGKYMVEQYTDFNAEVRIFGSVFPGTVITICDRQMKVSEKLDNVCIYYDQKNSQIAHKNLK